MGELPNHIVGLHTLNAAPRDVTVTASPSECAALAAAYGLPAIAALRGDFSLSLRPGGVVDAGLHMQARVTQDCVVTLEPFVSALDETVALRFVPAAEFAEDGDDANDPEAPDDIPYEGGTLDLGSALAEQLALGLDPYPRKPDAVFAGGSPDQDANPFAALRNFKANDDRA